MCGRLVVEELAKAEFATEWNETAQVKIAIKDIRWDKRYVDEEAEDDDE